MKEIYGHTTTDPMSLATLVLLAVLVLALPRRYAPAPYLLLACVVPFSQRIVIAGLDFNFTRLLVMVGAARIALRGEARRIHWTPLDYAVLAFIGSSAIIPILREASVAELIYRLGSVFDSIGLYFVFRLLIRSFKDFAAVARSVLVISIPVAVLFLLEWTTKRNFFSIYAGISPDTWIFQGRARCGGAFVHPIIAGVFWASLLPLVAVRSWHPGASRLLVALGMAATICIALAVGSSTPLLVMMVTTVAAFLYPVRFHLRYLRWGIVAALVGLEIVMKAHVWHLISRIGVLGGSAGYHRYLLIDAFINHFGEWWLLGTNSTGHWGHGLRDVTNEFIAQGARGGLSSFLLLVLVFVFAFRQVGIALRVHRRSRVASAYLWSLGLCLVAHMAAMFAVSYWAQILVPWNLTLAAVAALTPVRVGASSRAKRRKRTDGSVQAPAVVSDASLDGSQRPQTTRAGHVRM
jgi:hypothetical protein